MRFTEKVQPKIIRSNEDVGAWHSPLNYSYEPMINQTPFIHEIAVENYDFERKWMNEKENYFVF